MGTNFNNYYVKGDNMKELRQGKIIYLPPERCYAKVNIEETEYGYALYRVGESKPFTFIPHSAVKQIEYKGERYEH